MKKTFIAFYDALFFSIIASIMWTIAIIIISSGQINNFSSCVQNWPLVVAFAICVAVPVTLLLSLQKITIDLSCDKVCLFYLVNFKRNKLDISSNWIIYPSEIENIEVVKLSKEEKQKYTSAKFLFSKYLKVNLKFGHSKYIYVSHYSNSQIKEIIKLLTPKENHFC